ncbi:SOS (error prone) mutagenesis protein UmuD (RumA) [Legionella beliardensis]|uniref:SOS (Error prone) mutagenesis protein UmuD (RumA) n=2 Tax=Legionella beliardensis TaxID=91822 RepID=A0A378I152_9GAMM|nr:SOS (error prone) mutagenesis protein UmuD (RumA) [Legionella beliardensis]
MTHGGKRLGAGRPKGSGQYGEATCTVRIPRSRLNAVRAFLSTNPLNVGLPFFSTTIRAGCPTPIDEGREEYIDLNTHLASQPESTFIATASGDSMIEADIYEGDMLVVDSKQEACSGDIVIAMIHGEATVKRLAILSHEIQLLPENPRYQPIIVNNEVDFKVLGVVTHVIHRVK